MANNTPASPPGLGGLIARSAIGGVLMGLANLVPGISGGTMLLAAGVYPRFINAIGEITTLRFRKASLAVLLSVIVAAGLAIVLLAGPVKEMVVHYRWAMYSLFIGLTLGGVPIVWRLIRQGKGAMAGAWVGALVGFVGMAALAYLQMQGNAAADRSGFVFMFLAGAAGASAMILPGVSGGYLLLVLGVYVPILAAISAFKTALQTRNFDDLTSIGLGVILPVGIGVIVGIVVISNLLKWLLHRFERPTLGVLLGLLLGAVVGLYPFQTGVAPAVGTTLKGQTVVANDAPNAEWPLQFAESGKPVEPDDYPTQLFSPGATHLGGGLGLILLGFACTLFIDRFGSERKDTP